MNPKIAKLKCRQYVVDAVQFWILNDLVGGNGFQRYQI